MSEKQTVHFSRPPEACLSRRGFLGATAAGAVSELVPRVARRTDPRGAQRSHHAGRHRHRRAGTAELMALLQFPEIQVVAVCDVNRESGGYLSLELVPRQGTADGRPRTGPAMVEEYYAQGQAQRQLPRLPGLCRLPRVAGQGRCGRGDDRHARSHACRHHDGRAQGRQARVLREAADLVGRRGAAGDRGRAPGRRRHATGQPGPGHGGSPADLRDDLATARSARCARCRCGARPASGPGRRGKAGPPETPPVPEGLDWDLWLGPAPQRPYHPAYHPWTWRNWWDFGTGLLGDLGCHKLSTVFKALKLGHPTQRRGQFDEAEPGDLSAGRDRALRVSRARRLAAGDAHLVRRRTEAAAAAGSGAGPPHGGCDLRGRAGQAHGPPAHPRVEDAEARTAAEDAAPLARPLSGMGRCLPRRPARRLELRRPRRPADRGLPAGQRRVVPARPWNGTARTCASPTTRAPTALRREYRSGW